MDQITIPEYNLMVKALRYRLVDDEYRIHKLAYMATVARGTKGKNQTPVYPTFKKFFDYEKEIKALKVKKPDSRFKGIGKIIGKGDADSEQ